MVYLGTPLRRQSVHTLSAGDTAGALVNRMYTVSSTYNYTQVVLIHKLLLML